MRVRHLFVSSLIIVLLIISTMTISNFYADGAFQPWKTLGQPPVNAESVLQVDFGQNSIASIYLRSDTDGSIYRGSRALCEGENCWQRVDVVPNENTLSTLVVDNQCHSQFKKMIALKAIPVRCASYVDEASGSHLLREAHFVMLENSNYLVWQFIPGSGVLMILLIGCSLAFLVGTILFIGLSRCQSE